MRVDLGRLCVDQARLDAGDDMLECSAPLQCQSPHAELHSEVDKNPEQQQ